MAEPSTATVPSDLPEPRRPLLRRVLRRLRALVFEEQVAMRLPTRLTTQPPKLAADYTLRSATPDDHAAWVTLLSSDEGFGRWDMARLERDIVSQLLHPGSASLLFHQGRLVGCAATCLGKFRGRPQPMGMFLILDAAYRGQFKLSNALYRATLAHAEHAGHEAMFATTFPDRASALTLYLANSAQPVHTHLWSRVQWRRIHRRIGPIVARLKRRA